MTYHRIHSISFQKGFAICSCGARVVGGPPAEALRDAWSEHRREVGAPRDHGELGYYREGAAQSFRLRRNVAIVKGEQE